MFRNDWVWAIFTQLVLAATIAIILLNISSGLAAVFGVISYLYVSFVNYKMVVKATNFQEDVFSIVIWLAFSIGLPLALVYLAGVALVFLGVI